MVPRHRPESESKQGFAAVAPKMARVSALGFLTLCRHFNATLLWPPFAFRLTSRFMPNRNYAFGAFPEAQEEQMQEKGEFILRRARISGLILTSPHQQTVAPSSSASAHSLG